MLGIAAFEFPNGAIDWNIPVETFKGCVAICCPRGMLFAGTDDKWHWLAAVNDAIRRCIELRDSFPQLFPGMIPR